eukprot:TRINITY_DN36463_c0_g1_i1.p1 TRINITY_DN36463_c0_g1~~TRINITY_DN36463_c0_g1_i1.p1  ORF type:complete len:553 (-),score=121.95 TRINITY_DN36463_c0_g1_i1:401-2059(-)
MHSRFASRSSWRVLACASLGAPPAAYYKRQKSDLNDISGPERSRPRQPRTQLPSRSSCHRLLCQDKVSVKRRGGSVEAEIAAAGDKAAIVDVCVIGAGIMGSAVALEVAEAWSRSNGAAAGNNSRKVLLVEREAIGSGATGLSAATICNWGPGDGSLATPELTSRTVGLLQRLEAQGFDCGLRLCGLVEMISTKDELQWAMEETQRLLLHGYDISLLSAAEARQREAALVGKEDLLGALYQPLAGYAHPPSTNAAFRAALEQLGEEVVELWEDAKVTSCSRIEGDAPHTSTGDLRWRVLTADGRVIYCRHLVVAAGAWSGELCEQMGLRFPLATVKAQMWAAEAAQGATQPLQRVLYYAGSHAFMAKNDTSDASRGVPRSTTFDADGQRILYHFYGRPADFDGGVWCGGDRLPKPSAVSNDAWQSGVDERSNEENWRFAAHTLVPKFKETLTLPPLGSWAGLLAFTLHGDPLLGEVRQLPGLWLCTGFGGSGFMRGAGAGQVLAEWIVQDCAGGASAEMADVAVAKAARRPRAVELFASMNPTPHCKPLPTR